MSKNLILCHDFREPLKTVATVDEYLWRQIDEARLEAIRRGNDESEFCPWHGAMGYYSCVPSRLLNEKTSNEFCMNAYCIHEETLGRIAKAYGGLEKYYCDIDSVRNRRYGIEDLIRSGWVSLGFDICWAGLGASAIHTTRELEFAKRDYKDIWNRWGLIENLSDAAMMIDHQNFKPGDPTVYMPVEIYTNNFCPITPRSASQGREYREKAYCSTNARSIT